MPDLATDPLATNAQPTTGGLLIFGVGREEYAVDIALVEELRGYVPPTQLACAPEYLKGMINLRGTIVPLVDLRIYFGQPHPVYGNSTVVIVVNVHGATTGIVVDRVADVLWLTPDQLAAPPDMRYATAHHITAIGTIGERMPIVLDIAGLLQQLGCGAQALAA